MMTSPTYRNRSLTFTALVAVCALATVNGCSSSKSQEGSSDEVAPALDAGAIPGTDLLPPPPDGAVPPVASTDPTQVTTVAKTDAQPQPIHKRVTPKKSKTKHAAHSRRPHEATPQVAAPVEAVQEANITPPAPVDPAPAPAATVQAQQPPAPITPPPAAVVAKTEEHNTPERSPASPRNSEAKADEISAESGGFSGIFATYRNAILGSAVVLVGGIAGLSMKKKKSTQV